MNIIEELIEQMREMDRERQRVREFILSGNTVLVGSVVSIRVPQRLSAGPA